MMSTTIEMAIPPAVMNGTPATASPRIDTTTIPPANTTGRPAVAIDRAIESSTTTPRARCSRCLVVTNSA